MFKTGTDRRMCVWKQMDKFDKNLVHLFSEFEIADAFPVYGIRRRLVRKYVRQWAENEGIVLRKGL